LTSIAALTTTSFGRSFLALADAAAARTLIDVPSNAALSSYQPLDADLTSIAALTTTSIGRSLLATADAAAIRSIAGAEASGAAAAAQAASQPLDTDLTAIAALTTTSVGRSVLAAADAAAIRTIAGAEASGAAAAAQAASQPLDSDLTSIAALTTTATGRSLLAAADAAAIRTIAGAETAGAAAAAQAASQPVDSDLTALAALTTTAFGRSLLELADAAAMRAAAVSAGTGVSNTFTLPQIIDLAATGTALTLDVHTAGDKWLNFTEGGTARGSIAEFADFVAISADAGLLLTTTAGDIILAAGTGGHINASGKRIYGLADATAATDAVNRQFGDGRYQPLDSDLTSIAALTTTSYGRSLLAAADAAALRTLAGAVIGTNVQGWDADLDALAGLTSAANKGIQFTGSGTAATFDLTTAGKALLDDADATAQRTTLGLASLGTNFAVATLGNFTAAAVTADRVYYSQVVIPADCTLTGVRVYCSSATGNARSALYNSAGTRVANATADTTVATNVLQLPFASTYVAVPGVYFVACVFSGTPTLGQHFAGANSAFAAGPGSGATATSITPPTTVSGTRGVNMATY
jgi:hypothetical protein